MAWPQTVRKEDLRIEFTKGSGAGGQKRNKTSSAVRITHIPTNLSAYSEEDRKQSRNKEIAFKKLAEKLVPLMINFEKKERYHSVQIIRTYHEPDNRVKDIRVFGKQWSYDEVIHGDALADIIDRVVVEGE